MPYLDPQPIWVTDPKWRNFMPAPPLFVDLNPPQQHDAHVRTRNELIRKIEKEKIDRVNKFIEELGLPGFYSDEW